MSRGLPSAPLVGFGLRRRRADCGGIKWHELRHSFASILTTGGAPLRIVQSLLGHSTIRMTER